MVGEKGIESPGREKAEGDSKKARILELYHSGVTEVAEIARRCRTPHSYVASVLQSAGLLRGYFDLYTSSSEPMNVYSAALAGKLGFRDVPTAKRSTEILHEVYRKYQAAGDAAGMHHALMMALTMIDRARWSGKAAEARVYRDWLTERLYEPLPPGRQSEDQAPESKTG